MKAEKVLALAAVALAITLALQIGVRYENRPGPMYTATWKDNPATLAATHKLADLVVTARVAKITHADDIVTKAPGEPEDADRIPVEVVTLNVESAHKGKAKTIELFHTGHSDAPSPADKPDPTTAPPPKPAKGAVEKSRKAKASRQEARTIMLHDDPEYKLNERYVLFVRKGPKITVRGAARETMAVVAPVGRFRISAANVLEPVAMRGFAAKLRGQPVKTLQTELSRMR